MKSVATNKHNDKANLSETNGVETNQVERIVMQLLSEPDLLINVQNRLAQFIIFDKWVERKHDNGFERNEPGKNGSRLFVYEEDGGWYYRVGFGVIGLAGFRNETAFDNAKAAMNAVDEMLNKQKDIIAA